MTEPRRYGPTWFAAVALVAVLALGGCAKKATGTATASRPSTTARIRIASPEQDTVVHGTSVHVVIELLGGKLVPLNSTKLVQNGGHIHLLLDGQIKSMALGTEQDLTGLSAGHHIITAEFVAADHKSFTPRKLAAVTISVEP